MKYLKDIIQERLHITKDTKSLIDDDSYKSINKQSSKSEIKEVINELNNYAAEKELKVVLRNYSTSAGDFCMFVYDKSKYASPYLVGYDGDWDSHDRSFQYCYEQVKKFIDHFKR